MRRFALAIWLSCSFATLAVADESGISQGSGLQRGPVRLATEDGATICTPTQDIEVSNATLTDDGDGNCSVTTGGGSAAPTDAEYVVTEANGTLSAEVAPSATNQVPNSTSSTAGSWTDSPILANLDLQGTGPDIRLSPTGGDVFGLHAEFSSGTGSLAFFSNVTDGRLYWLVDNAHNFYLPQLGGNGLRCLQIANTGVVGVASAACGSGGGSGNSFETINVPAGTDPVAESSTDTLNITETSFLTITGDSATDSIDITQVTTDLGTDGLIAANAVALGTDTTNAYVATVADSGTGNLTVSGSGAETAAVTINTVQDILTTSTPTFANMLFAGTGPDARFTPTSGESFHIGAEYAASTGTLGMISDASSGIIHMTFDLDNNLTYLNRLAGTGTRFVKVKADGELTATSTFYNGANPTLTTAGEISVDTSSTTGAALRFFADAQYTLPAWQAVDFILSTPTASSDFEVFCPPANITIRQIRVLSVGGTNVVGGLQECNASGTSCSAVDADITASAGTVATDDGSLTNATIDANDQLQWLTTSISGSPTRAHITIFYTYDAINS